MSKTAPESLGTGENIYEALEAGYGSVPSGPLQGVLLHVPRERPDWQLPETMYHLTVWRPLEEIRELIDESYAEAQKTGAAHVPSQVFEHLYNQAREDPENLGMQAGFESGYVIKGLAFHFPYQMQRVIEINTARAIVGSYRDPDIPSKYRYAMQENFMPMGLPELYDFFFSIEDRFQQRQDRSQIGTDALADEIERLVTQVLNDRWDVLALPRGDDSGPIIEGGNKARDKVAPRLEDIQAAHTNIVAAIGSERIIKWNVGSTLEALGSYATGASSSLGENNPFDEIRNELTVQIKAADKNTAKELRELLWQLQDLGDLGSRYRAGK